MKELYNKIKDFLKKVEVIEHNGGVFIKHKDISYTMHFTKVECSDIVQSDSNLLNLKASGMCMVDIMHKFNFATIVSRLPKKHTDEQKKELIQMSLNE